MLAKNSNGLLEIGRDGHPVGRDPRGLSAVELNSCGHPARPLLSAVRARCLDCSADSAGEVRLCTATACALWPYRMGSNPFRVGISEEERARRGRRLLEVKAHRALSASSENSEGRA